MKTIMKSLTEVIMCFAIVTLFCACVMTYPSTALGENANDHELDALIQELRKLLNINTKSNTRNIFSLINTKLADTSSKDLPNFRSLAEYSRQEDNMRPLLTALLSKGDNTDSFDVSKRQGSWDYDYGLGGGRFGKRARGFGDYVLGGGRFGRDVDHVTDMDNDAMLDFVDPTEE